MTRHDRRVRVLAACLAAVAGFVDAAAFIELGGFFVSFMSGNTTRLGVGLAGNLGHAATAAGLVIAFVSGVAVGSLVGRRSGRHRRPIVLILVATLLALAALLGGLGAGAALTVMALAMGAENAVFEQDGEVRIGLTYMTGTLVKIGQRLANAITGEPKLEWAPYLFLWLGLAAGAAIGAAAYTRFGLQSLWAAAATTLILAAIAATLESEADPGAGR